MFYFSSEGHIRRRDFGEALFTERIQRTPPLHRREGRFFRRIPFPFQGINYDKSTTITVLKLARNS